MSRQSWSCRVKYWFLFVSLIVGAAACEAMNDGSYEGEPRFVLNGTIQGLADGAIEGDIYLAVDWVNIVRRDDPDISQNVSISDTSFPSSFSITFYDEPPEVALNDFAFTTLQADGLIGTGTIFVFEDLDADGEIELRYNEERQAYEADDRILGWSDGYVMLFAKEVSDELIAEIEALDYLIVNPTELKPGYNLARAVCEPGLDRLEIIPPEQIAIRPAEGARDFCYRFY